MTVHTFSAPPRRRGALALATILVLSIAPGCDGDSGPARDGGGGPAVASSKRRRDDRPEAVRARTLIDDGRTDLAAPLVESLAGVLGLEAPLLRARITVLEGNRAGWLGMIEEARAIDAKDPRPYATAAELYAMIGRVDAAIAELERGISAVGSLTPEMQRAKGIIAIVRPGGGTIGLGLLQAALRADPGLPFMGRPLGQAYLLAAKHAIAENLGALALEHIERSLAYDAEDPDARHLQGETLFRVNHEYSRGLAILEILLAEGEPIEELVARLSWSAGLAAQLNHDPDSARRHYVRARELGSFEVKKGTARTFLRGLADAAFERAVVAARGGDVESTRARVDEAIDLAGDGELSRAVYAESFARRANTALTAGELDAASSLLTAAIDTDPDAASIKTVGGALYFARALDALEEGDGALAVTLAEKSTKANPDDAMTLHFLGELRYARREYAEAAQALDGALRKAALDGEPLPIGVQLTLAECQHLSGSIEDAVATLQDCLRSTRPEDAAARERATRYLELLEDDG